MEQEKINVLVIEPEKRPYTKEISSRLESLQHEVGGNIQATYPYDTPVAILCDEEGKLTGKPLNRALRDEDGHIYDVVAGTFLVVGLDEENFTSLSPEQMEQFAVQFKTPEMFVRVNGKLLVMPMQEVSDAFPPVYLHSASYAFEHGELAEYRTSYQANLACKDAIEQAISGHYRDNCLGHDAAKGVLKQFGAERVQFILANTVRHKDWDGRISRDNKAWAKTISMLEDNDSSCLSAYLVIDKINPGLIDLFLKQVRKSVQKPERSSVLQRLKQELPAHKPAVSKKHEPGR